MDPTFRNRQVTFCLSSEHTERTTLTKALERHCMSPVERLPCGGIQAVLLQQANIANMRDRATHSNTPITKPAISARGGRLLVT